MYYYCKAFSISPNSPEACSLTPQEVWSFWFMEQIEGKAAAKNLSPSRIESMTLRLLDGQVSKLGEMFLIVSEEPEFENATHDERSIEAEKRLKEENQE